MFDSLLSFALAAVLVSADLALLVVFARRLGRAAGSGLGLLVLMEMLKLGLLVLGAAWLARQPWNDRRAMIAGLLLPFALFIAWQALSLNLSTRRRV
ncbi:MAG: hypothetical protein ACREKE_05490 [bacterium]